MPLPKAILSPTSTNKRKSVVAADIEPAKKTKMSADKSAASPAGTATATTGSSQEAPGKKCHHCHNSNRLMISCTLMRSKAKKRERCAKTFCETCLKKHYNTSIEDIKAQGKADPFKILGHDTEETYTWKCPVCDNKCNCYNHRKKEENKEDQLAKFAQEAGVSVDAVKGMADDKTPRVAAQKTEKATPKTKVEKKPKTAEKNKEKVDVKKPSAKKADPKEKIQPPVDGMMTMKLPLASGPPKSVLKKPRDVEEPNFQFIILDQPLEIVFARIRLREFVLRFERKINLIPKYMRIINDPNSHWSDLTYKNLIISLMSIIQSDDNPPVNHHLALEAIKTIRAAPPDDPSIWTITTEFLSADSELEPMKDIESNDAYKLDIVNWLAELTLRTSTLRKQIDDGLATEKKNHQAMIDETKRLKLEWEELRTTLQKERLTIPATGKAEFEARYTAAQQANKSLILAAESREWYANRKLGPRTSHLGTDTMGNNYWLFLQRDKKEEDWGNWIVVEKGNDLPHPLGKVPPPPSMPSDNGMDIDVPEVPQPDDEETIAARVWYCLDTAEDVKRAADWIKCKGDTAIYWQEVLKQSRPMTPVSSVPASPMSPSRKVLDSVRAVKKREEEVTKDHYMPLVDKLKKIAGFMGWWEENR